MTDELELDLEPDPADNPHLHPLDPISLALGAIFTLIGAIFLLGDVNAADLSPVWAWAALFGSVGLLLIAIGVRRHRR